MRRTAWVAAVAVAMASTALPSGGEALAAATGDPARERGRVVHVADGDTLDVDVFGDGTSTPKRVRLSGINTPEIGDCYADVATRRLRRLVLGETVTLRAADRASSSGGRLLRQVMLPRRDRAALDVNRQLLHEGRAVWFPLGSELTHTASYHLTAERARRAGRGWWRGDVCGAGPAARARLQVWAKSDADSADGRNLDDEYVVVANAGGDDVRLGGWSLRDSSLFAYRLPKGTVVPARGRITVRVGAGTDTATVKHMRRSKPLLDNTNPATGAGDGIYLLDPDGDLRASFSWPCVLDCDEPLAGAVEITDVVSDPKGADRAIDEVVTLRNVSDRRVTLDEYQLRTPPYAHAFRPGTRLAPGERMTVRMGAGTSSRTEQFLGRTRPVLDNGGDVVELLSWDERPAVDCVAWGKARCPQPVSPPALSATALRSQAVVAGDWDGDGRVTPGLFLDGRWHLSDSLGSGVERVVDYGRPSDVPVVGDWNGNGRDTIGIVRDGTWHLTNGLGGGADHSFAYGRVSQGDVPLVGDWNGDGRDTIGIVRDGTWHLRGKLAGGRSDASFVYGRVSQGDVPLVGDWNGDGRDRIGIVRDGAWHLKDTLSGGRSDRAFTYGRVLQGDVPLVGDWNRDGADTAGIVRDGMWHLKQSLSGGDADQSFAY